MLDFENLQLYREDNRIEAKQALGGLPESIWETYSAFANAEGGVILLGVEELPDKRLHAMNLLDPQWLIEDFWAILNDPMQVSVNILKEEDVQIHQVEGKTIVAITVPKAERENWPVYIGNDIYRGSYRRCGEGDYRIPREEIDALLTERDPRLSAARAKLFRDVAAFIEACYEPEDEDRSDFEMGPVMADCAVLRECAPCPMPMAARPAPSLEEMLAHTDAGFSETLLKLIDGSGKKDSEIYTRANVSRQHFSKIRNNPGYRPTKATAIAFAIALELDLEQTRDLIGRAGYALTNSSKFDVIIMYFIREGNYNMFDINSVLFEFDQSLLGA